MSCNNVISALFRRKTIEKEEKESDSQLKRCLSMFDLTCLGIGSTLGLGVYVLAGDVASRSSGPAVSISFLIAAVASVFAGLCYAEFGGRVPRAGSAYVYSYVTVGELMAFVIGWNLVLEYVIGTASVARGYSVYIDSLFHGTIAKHLTDWVPLNMEGTLAPFPDPIAFGLTILLTLLLALGVKESIRLHTIMTVVNLSVVVFVVIAGLINVGIQSKEHGWSYWHNWELKINSTEVHNGGKGGFFPFGVAGMMQGAATCFYAFVGFDAIATTGEEAKNPKRSIPLSIIFSLLLIFLAYFGISMVQTLMMPYYLQVPAETNGAPLPWIFEQVGWVWAKWIVSIGALNGLSTSLLGAMYPLPRVLYAMAMDGVIFRFLGNVNHRTQTPIWATLLAGLLAAVMASLFDIDQLADMMSIGTLLAYSLVAISILIIRFSASPKIEEDEDYLITNSAIMGQMLSFRRKDKTTRLSAYTSNMIIVAISIDLIIFAAILNFEQDNMIDLKPVPIVFACLTLAIAIALIVVLASQPQIGHIVSFEVPWVPLIPFLSVFVNIYLMLQLKLATWIRFVVWMIIGFLIYFCYGIWHSSERKPIEERQPVSQYVMVK